MAYESVKMYQLCGVTPGVKCHRLQCDGQYTTILGDVYLVTGCTTLSAITVGNDSIIRVRAIMHGERKANSKIIGSHKVSGL